VHKDGEIPLAVSIWDFSCANRGRSGLLRKSTPTPILFPAPYSAVWNHREAPARLAKAAGISESPYPFAVESIKATTDRCMKTLHMMLTGHAYGERPTSNVALGD